MGKDILPGGMIFIKNVLQEDKNKKVKAVTIIFYETSV